MMIQLTNANSRGLVLVAPDGIAEVRPKGYGSRTVIVMKSGREIDIVESVEEVAALCREARVAALNRPKPP